MKTFNSIKIEENKGGTTDIQIFVDTYRVGCFELHEYAASQHMKSLKIDKEIYIIDIWESKILPLLSDVGRKDIQNFRNWFFNCSFVALRINNLTI